MWFIVLCYCWDGATPFAVKVMLPLSSLSAYYDGASGDRKGDVAEVRRSA